MNYKKTLKPYHKIVFLLAMSVGISSTSLAKTNEYSVKLAIQQDSIGNEIVNGQRFLIHKLQPQQTYYQLGRIYSIPVKDIMDANNKKSLKVGDNVRIPRGKAQETPQVKKDIINKVLVNPQDITEYIVGKTETLYAISRRFSISVDDIKKVNGLTSDNVREGQVLKIPNKSLAVEVPKVIDTPKVIEPEENPIDDSIFKPNKYGIREKREKGVAVSLDYLSTDSNTSLALHKTAPIGTILKIVNPMNRSVTFAKVVGKFTDNHDTQDAIVVVSKATASSIGILDKRFQVEITYGIPLE